MLQTKVINYTVFCFRFYLFALCNKVFGLYYSLLSWINQLCLHNHNNPELVCNRNNIGCGLNIMDVACFTFVCFIQWLNNKYNWENNIIIYPWTNICNASVIAFTWLEEMNTGHNNTHKQTFQQICIWVLLYHGIDNWSMIFSCNEASKSSNRTAMSGSICITEMVKYY